MNRLDSQLLNGAVAGLVATGPMTVVMMLLHRLLPEPERYPLPPYEITVEAARRTGVSDELNPEERSTAAGIAHFAYGAAAGSVYGALAPYVPASPLVGGVAYGLAVWGGSYLGLLPALGILKPATEHPPGRNALMIAAHMVWGSATGLLVDQFQRLETSSPEA